jgi:hypothetical protein
MHTLLPALLLWGQVVDVSGQAAAQPPDVTLQSAPATAPDDVAPVAPDVAPVAPPAVAAEAQLRVLREQLFARDALYLDFRAHMLQDGRTIDAADAYLIVGRPDLANQVRRRRTAKGVARGVGIAALTLGLVWGIVEGIAVTFDNGIHRLVNGCGSMSIEPQCADRSHVSAIPGVMIVGGAAAWVTGAVMPEDPLGDAEKGRLVDDYNRRLRAGMGLSF